MSDRPDEPALLEEQARLERARLAEQRATRAALDIQCAYRQAVARRRLAALRAAREARRRAAGERIVAHLRRVLRRRLFEAVTGEAISVTRASAGASNADPNLHLDDMGLSTDQVFGVIWPHVGECVNQLTLAHNRMKGTALSRLDVPPTARMNLKVLDVSGNCLRTRESPPSGSVKSFGLLAAAPMLTSLTLRGNTTLKVLPCGVPQLHRLRVLNLEGCALSELPDLSRMWRLGTLNMRGNKLERLSTSLAKLPHLTALDVSDNPHLHGELIGLALSTSLTTLNASGTNMSDELPAPLRATAAFSNLRTLILARSPLSSLRGIQSVAGLVRLDISYTAVSELPQEIARCEEIKTMNLEHTAITHLPGALLALRNLRAIRVAGCPLEAPTSEEAELNSLGLCSMRALKAFHQAAVEVDDDDLGGVLGQVVRFRADSANKLLDPESTLSDAEAELHTAAAAGDIVAVKRLIRAASVLLDLDSRDFHGSGALHKAAVSTPDAVPKPSKSRFKPPQSKAAASAEQAEKTVLYLLKKGADPQLTDKGGKAVLHLCAGRPGLEKATAQIASGCEGGQISRRDNAGRTALFDACGSGSPEAVAILKGAGLRFDVEDAMGRICIFACAETGRIDTLEKALALGAGVVHRDDKRMTAGDYAAKCGHKNVSGRVNEGLARAGKNRLRSRARMIGKFAAASPFGK